MNAKTVATLARLTALVASTDYAGERVSAERQIARLTRVPRAYGLLDTVTASTTDLSL